MIFSKLNGLGNDFVITDTLFPYTTLFRLDRKSVV